MRRGGFTLLEVLAVLALLGVLLALGIPNYTRWRDTSSIRQAQAIIAVELSNARTTAKRTNAARTVTWILSTFGGRSLEGVAITEPPQTITYRPPYGTLADVGGVVPTYTLTLTRGGYSGVVRVSGVFGKAIAQPVN